MTTLDSRTLLVWGTAAMVPLLVSRHPVIVGLMLVVVLTVRTVCFPGMRQQWRWIARLAVLMSAIGIVFNTLTVRSGNQVLTRLPLLDWPVTWNAIAYGLVSGVALITLVLTGITVAAGLDWLALIRVLPRRLAPIAVSGSVAWAFLPAAGQSIAEIREAQAARGHEIRSGRDLLPMIVPLLDSGMGRAITMSEALEARGFGGSMQARPSVHRLARVWAIVAVVSLLIAAFGLSTGVGWLGTAATLLTATAILLWIRVSPASTATTAYRLDKLRRRDRVVMVVSLFGLIAFITLWRLEPTSVLFIPYPNLVVEPTNPLIVLALALLLVPAMYPVEGPRP